MKEERVEMEKLRSDQVRQDQNESMRTGHVRRKRIDNICNIRIDNTCNIKRKSKVILQYIW